MTIGAAMLRNHCFALISAIEVDLREFIVGVADPGAISDLMPEDVASNAAKRFRHNQEERGAYSPDVLPSMRDLVDHSDFADLCKMLSSKPVAVAVASKALLSEAREHVSTLNPIRHRVCHSRPLEQDDFDVVRSVATLLAKSKSISWSNTKSALERLRASDGMLSGHNEIPGFWASGGDRVLHNLPLPDFEDTGFLGRDEERKNLRTLLRSHYPVVSVVGEGGIGKTALVLRCLYDLLDDANQPFDAIVWSTAKHSILTADGVRYLNNSVRSTFGLLQALSSGAGSPSAMETAEEAVSELVAYMTEFKVLIVIDNLEAVSANELRPLLLNMPPGSKLLITSRVGLSEFEVRLPLEAMREQDAAALIKRTARVLGVDVLLGMSADQLKRCLRALFKNPLLIKWFVASVGRGQLPDEVLSHSGPVFSNALAYCFESLFDRLSHWERHIVWVLHVCNRPLSFDELSYFAIDASVVDLRAAINALTNSSIVKMVRDESSGEFKWRLTDSAHEYVRVASPPADGLVEQVRQRRSEWQNILEAEANRQSRYRYDVYSVYVTRRQDTLAAVYLRNALSASKNGKAAEARSLVERASDLQPQSPEVHRVSALIYERAGEIFRAEQEYDKAVELMSDSPIVRYSYGRFLLQQSDPLRAREQFEWALRLDPNDGTLKSSLALASCRLSDYERAAELYGDVVRAKSFVELPMGLRIAIWTQISENARRWSEVAKQRNDAESFKRHIVSALDAIAQAISRQECDSKMRNQVGKIVDEVLFDALGRGRVDFVEAVLDRVSELLVKLPGRGMLLKASARLAAGDEGLRQLVQGWLRNVDELSADDAYAMGGENVFEGVLHTVISDKAYGFIAANGRRFFFHFSGVRQYAAVREHFVPGAKVQFKIGSNKQGECAVEVELMRE